MKTPYKLCDHCGKASTALEWYQGENDAWELCPDCLRFFRANKEVPK